MLNFDRDIVEASHVLLLVLILSHCNFDAVYCKIISSLLFLIHE